ncbi:MAG TPA: electron transfer flavoprotein subunit alpha/FixB family protein, partial [Negativicutes bacterium]
SILAPDVCIAVGVSGAAAFAVGIEKSKFIIAINKDEKAPIFKIADVAICAEYQEIVAELIKLATPPAH